MQVITVKIESNFKKREREKLSAENQYRVPVTN